MPETPLWDELTRSEQRLLIRLFGGGSLRNQNPEDVEGLCRRGLVDDEQNLSVPGLLALTCQSAFKFDPVSASNFDPFERRVLAVALASSELAGVAKTWRARAV